MYAREGSGVEEHDKRSTPLRKDRPFLWIPTPQISSMYAISAQSPLRFMVRVTCVNSLSLSG